MARSSYATLKFIEYCGNRNELNALVNFMMSCPATKSFTPKEHDATAAALFDAKVNLIRSSLDDEPAIAGILVIQLNVPSPVAPKSRHSFV